MNNRDQNNKNQSQDYIKPDEILPGTNRILANNLLNINQYFQLFSKEKSQNPNISWEEFINKISQ